MVAENCWQELCRFDDLLLARAVATSIAAMEFDVCLDAPDEPPFVVQVSPGNWHELAGVLGEIIDEQQEFDRQLAQRQSASRGARIVAVISFAGAGELILHLARYDW